MEIEYHITDMTVKNIENRKDVVVEVIVKAVHILPNTLSVSTIKILPIEFVDSPSFIEFESLTKEQVLSFIDKTSINNELQNRVSDYGKIHKIPSMWS